MPKKNYDDHSFSGTCPTCAQPFLLEAFETAKAFIDSHAADPDLTDEMVGKYLEYQDALKRLIEGILDADACDTGKAVIVPFKFNDIVTGNTLEVSVSPRYSKIKINDREYYFIKETGEFDGTAMPMKDK